MNNAHIKAYYMHMQRTIDCEASDMFWGLYCDEAGW